MPHATSAVSRLCLAAGLLLLAAPPAGAAADKPATNDPYTVSLPNGVTLQLFAVAVSPSLDRPWWKPDGSAIDAPPYDHLGYRPYADQGKQCYELAVRVSGLPEGEELHRSVGDKEQYYVNGGGKPFAGDAQVEGMRAFTVYAEPAVATATLSFRVAANQWKTLRTFKEAGVYGEGPDRVQVIKPERPGGAARPEDMNNPRFNVQMLNTDASMRLVAVDADGKVYANKGSEWWGRDEHGVYAAFPDLPHERVKEYRLEACPYHSVVFPDVKLRPADADAAAARAAKWRVDRLRAQEAKAGPDVALRVAGAMRALRSSRKAFDDADAWGRALRDVGEIGPPAVPALAAELNRSARPYVRSNVAIALRLVGDPRGVPGLATSLASTSFAPNDYGGLRFKDEKLKGYLARAVEMDRNGASFGRPVNEITNSLVALSGGHSEGDQQDPASASRPAPKTESDEAVTPLHLALSRKDMKIVRLLLDAGADPNGMNTGQTPLTWAAQQGNVELTRQLIAAKARVDEAGKGHPTPLSWAALNKHVEVVRLLVEAGADVNSDGGGYLVWTPLNCALQVERGRGRGPDQTEEQAYQVAEYLLSKGANPNRQVENDGYTPIFGRGEKLGALLLKYGAKLDARTKTGETPLHYACYFDDKQSAIRFLLAHKADVNARDEQRRTPLHACFRLSASPTIVEMILKAGADPNAKDKDGRTPVHYAAEKGNAGVPIQVLAEILDSAAGTKADPNARDNDGATPLHLAAKLKHKETIELLLSHGADPKAKDKSGKTPADWAEDEETKRLLATK